MHREPRIAARAGCRPAARWAEQRRRVTAPVQVQQHLSTGIEVALDREHGRRRDALRGGVPAQVDQVDRGRFRAAGAARQAEQRRASRLRALEALERRRGRAEHDGNRQALRASQRQVARGVAEAFLLLVRGVVFLVDDDQPGVGERRENSGPRADHDGSLAAARRTPGPQSFDVGQRRVQHGERHGEARGETGNQLRRQRDLGHQHQRLLAALHDGVDRAQVDLGLAAARDPVQQERRVAARGGGNRLDRVTLLRRGLRPGACGDRDARRGGRRDLEPAHPATLLEFPHVVAPPRGQRAQRGLVRGLVPLQELDQFAELVRAWRQRRQLPGPGGGAQRPMFGGLERGGARAERAGQRCRENLARRMAVVLRGPQQQLEQRRVENRRLVDQRSRRAEFRLRDGGAGREFDEYRGDPLAPERHPETLARLQPGGIDARRAAIVEQTPQRHVDGHAQDRVHRLCRLCEVVHNGCGKVCG